MLQQYVEYKQRYPDCLILFQVGDFYEIFYDDAVQVARTINLTLTSRDKSSATPTPMCGVPIATLDGYLERLVAAGFSCAVVSQLLAGDDPASKGGVPRKLTRMVTPGIRILSGPQASSADALCVAVAVSPDGQEAAFAASDVQTGQIIVSDEMPLADLPSELQVIAPSEVLLPNLVEGKPLDRRAGWVRRLEHGLSGAPLKFRSGPLAQALQAAGSRDLKALKGFSALSPLVKRAVWGLVDYIDETTVSGRLALSEVTRKALKAGMRIDASARRNLELVKNARDGGTSGTLFSVLNLTVSEAGARLLRHWIVEPLASRAEILARLDAVEALKNNTRERQNMRDALLNLSDIERIVSRIELGVVSPREFGALRDALRTAEKVHAGEGRLSPLLKTLIDELPSREILSPGSARDLLEKTLAERLPLVLSDGGVIRTGWNADLDRIRDLKRGSTEWMEAFEEQEKARTGISSLKIKSNNMLGFFIEITRANVHRVPADYIRRQSTAQQERFTTDALREREKEFSGAEQKELALEKQLFEELRLALVPSIAALRKVATILSTLDVLSTFAEVAEREGFVRPVVDDSGVLEVREGRHPVIARLLRGSFVANDLSLKDDTRRSLIITGPNMGGKSTYLRQAALLVIMAQMGSFVAAASAHVGIVDQVFARIGASDNLAEGESTFMVEMREMSHIVKSATGRSLLLIDEVGRGTATTDGLVLAQSILEWIVSETKARTLFATHFHELTALAATHPSIANLSVTSIEEGDDVVFTHHLKEGPASKSYGIEVAKLAGLPESIVDRARDLFREAQQNEMPGKAKNSGMKGAGSSPQLPLFGAAPGNSKAVEEGKKAQKDLAAIKKQLSEIPINETTPLQALRLLSELCEGWGRK
jgi:DNA mismatch repair protein MutS